MHPVNLYRAFDAFTERWQPHRLTSVNDHDLKVARVEGAFVWHAHPDSDELFLLVEGALTIGLREGADAAEREVVLTPGDVFVVPRGVEHRPVSDGESRILMVELNTTVNTGDAGGDRTVEVRELG